MEIRKASPEDVPEIVTLLKNSLGESKVEKTEKIWNFKHVDNPFGKSLVLLAEEEGEIIGVRAFMRWQWQMGNQVFSAFRAVDTATHPKHRGKGIFKKLTLKALDIGKEEGVHFVFNTPNEQSKPGYLKMGWKEVSKLNIQLTPVNPFRWKRKSNFTYGHQIEEEKSIPDLCAHHNENQILQNKFFTPKSATYLKWRYEDNALQNYHIIQEKDFYMAAYVKEHPYFCELRIVELLVSNKTSIKKLKKKLRSLAGKFGVQVISVHPNTVWRSGFLAKIGPVLTLRNINLDDRQENCFQDLSSWNYTLGELELF